MSDILEKVKTIGKTAIDKTGDALEIGTLKAKKAGKNSELKSQFTKLGKYFYLKSEEMPSDEESEKIIAEIEKLKEDIAELEDKIEDAKDGNDVEDI